MGILRNRALVVIGLAESVSGVGNWVTMLAVFSMVVFRGQGGVGESSAIFLAGLLPALPAGPLAGWLVDRYDRKWLMIGSELLDGLTVAGLIFARRLEVIYALLACQAVVMSIMTPARQAVVPDIVDGEVLARGNAFLQQLAGIIKIGGPALAGILLATLDPHTAIILDVVSFGLSALILTRLPALPPRGERAPAEGNGEIGPKARRAESGDRGKRRSRESLAELRESAGLRLLFAGTFLAVVVIVGFDVLSSILTRDVLRANESFFGLLVSLVGLGSAGVALLLLLRRGERDPWLDVLAGLFLLACLPAALAIAAGLAEPGLARAVAAVGCFAGGLGNGLVGIQSSTLMQKLAAPRVLGRVAGLFQSTMIAGQLVGIVLTPLLVPRWLPIGSYFVLATAAMVALSGCVGLLSRRAPAAQRAG